MQTQSNNDRKPERFSYDYRKLKFAGSEKHGLAVHIINWVSILILTAIICWFLKGFVVPMLASAAGGALLSNLGKLFKIWKGGRSP